jgi:hypothetical protein
MLPWPELVRLYKLTANENGAQKLREGRLIAGAVVAKEMPKQAPPRRVA